MKMSPTREHPHDTIMEKYFPKFYSANKQRLPAKYPLLQVSYRIMLQKRDKASGTYAAKIADQKRKFQKYIKIRAQLSRLSKQTRAKNRRGEWVDLTRAVKITAQKRSVAVQIPISCFKREDQGMQTGHFVKKSSKPEEAVIFAKTQVRENPVRLKDMQETSQDTGIESEKSPKKHSSRSISTSAAGARHTERAEVGRSYPDTKVGCCYNQ